MLEALTLMSDYVIVQTPYANDKESCGGDVIPEILTAMMAVGKLLGESQQFEGHMPRPIFKVKGTFCPKLTMSSWTSPENCIDAPIDSTFHSKTIELKPQADCHRDHFIHGLNLWNFAQLNGAWPRREEVLKLIREFPLPAEQHGDITAHNFLFDGAELHLIDGHEGWEFDDAEGLRKTAAAMGFV